MEEKKLKDDKFSIVSKIYSKNFENVVFIIFNHETGELRKEVINNHIDNQEIERKIMAETALNIKGEINRLLCVSAEKEANYIYNSAIRSATECCNGYQ